MEEYSPFKPRNNRSTRRSFFVSATESEKNPRPRFFPFVAFELHYGVRPRNPKWREMIPDSPILPQLRTNSSHHQDVRRKESTAEPLSSRSGPSFEREKKHETELDARFRDELQKSETQEQKRRDLEARQQSDLNRSAETVSRAETPSPGSPPIANWENHWRSPNQSGSARQPSANPPGLIASNVADDPRLADETGITDLSESKSPEEENSVEALSPGEIGTLTQADNGTSQATETEEESTDPNDGTVDSSFRQIAEDSAVVAGDAATSDDAASLVKLGIESNSRVTPTTSESLSRDQARPRLAIESLTGVSTESSGEPDMSNPGFQSDQSDSSQSPLMANGEGLSLESAGQPVTETAARAGFPTSTATEIGRAVSQRVSEVIIQEINLANNHELKQITLHLHPAELGRLTLQVGWESDSIIARIVASERATSEMLNGDKNWLIDALSGQRVGTRLVRYFPRKYRARTGLGPTRPKRADASRLEFGPPENHIPIESRDRG